MCPESPILSRRLPFRKDSSRLPSPPWNLSFWDYPGLNVRYLWGAWVALIHHLCSYPPSLLLSTIFIISFRFMSTKAFIVLSLPKKCHPRVWKSIQFVIFKPWKTLWNSIDYIIEIPVVMFGGYSRKLSQRHFEIQRSRGNLEEQNVLESAFSGFQRA